MQGSCLDNWRGDGGMGVTRGGFECSSWVHFSAKPNGETEARTPSAGFVEVVSSCGSADLEIHFYNIDVTFISVGSINWKQKKPI